MRLAVSLERRATPEDGLRGRLVAYFHRRRVDDRNLDTLTLERRPTGVLALPDCDGLAGVLAIDFDRCDVDDRQCYALALVRRLASHIDFPDILRIAGGNLAGVCQYARSAGGAGQCRGKYDAPETVS
jgi:hypothetical protein